MPHWVWPNLLVPRCLDRGWCKANCELRKAMEEIWACIYLFHPSIWLEYMHLCWQVGFTYQTRQQFVFGRFAARGSCILGLAFGHKGLSRGLTLAVMGKEAELVSTLRLILIGNIGSFKNSHWVLPNLRCWVTTNSMGLRCQTASTAVPYVALNWLGKRNDQQHN